MHPTEHFSILGGMCRIAIFGRDSGDMEIWRKGNKTRITHALTHLSTNGARIFMPYIPEMNAEVCEVRHLLDSVHAEKISVSGSHAMLYRAESVAEGVAGILPGDMCTFSPADCATIVAQHGDDVIVAHAGMQSLADLEFYKTGIRTRRYESVIEAIMHAFTKLRGSKPYNPAHVYVWIGFAISSGAHFTFPFDGKGNEHNERMARDIAGRFSKDSSTIIDGKCATPDIIKLACAQFQSYGVSAGYISTYNVCPYTDTRFWSNRRGDKERNLVVVQRHF